MRIPSGMAAWMCIWAIGVSAWARAEEPTLEQSSGEVATDESYLVDHTARRQLFEDVYEYSYRVRVGLGVYDVITLHRVVREVSPNLPMRSPKSVFLVHGDVLGFRAAFLGSVASTAVPKQHSLAIFLAKQGVDVWGIDLRWVHVPAETTDFSFMKDWNLGLYARDLGVGLKLARGVRASGGNGTGRMALLGWSRGAAVSYAYLNAETRLPQEMRQVSGFIPVDMPYAFAPEHTAERQAACKMLATYSQLQASGQYEGGQVGALLQFLSSLAISAPDEGSLIIPGLTNRQTGRVVGAATYQLQNPPIIPVYHWTGGELASGVPTALSWTRERFFFDALMQASPYQSIGEQVDTLAMWCGAPDVPYDDYLHEVKVPVLYVGAAGGIGRYGLYSLGLLGSWDDDAVDLLVVQRKPDADRALDYGHADPLMADDAPTTVWMPLLNWLLLH